MTQEPTALPSGLTQRVSAEIRAELARQQMSQRQLAELLEMQPAVLSRRLNGTGGWRTLTTTEIDRIAVLLGVPVDRLLTAPSAVAA